MIERRSLTRRDALARAAVAGAGALLGPGVTAAGARAAAGAPTRARAGSGAGTGVFTREVGTLAPGVPASVGVDRAFCLAAVGWREPAHAGIELRIRRADGDWGPWATASCAGHDGDGVIASGRIGEGVWTDRAHELQLRSRHSVRGVALTLVDARAVEAGPGADRAGAAAAGADAAGGRDAAGGAGALPLAAPDLPAGPGQPPIIARRAWAGANHPPVAGPFYGTVEMGIVHHTENPNGYSAAEVPAMLRAIYEFHVHGRGWFDIGYNFVIDRFGRVWEARQGGIDLPVSGAQAGDWNQISFGVSMLGTYDSILPSAAALTSLERLLAWKLALSGLPAGGDISATATSDGIQWTQFHVGERLRFPRIAGHRQVDATSCPGDDLYDHLPVVRARTAALLRTPATLAISGTLSAPSGSGPMLELTGRLVRPGRGPLAGAAVTIQAIVGHSGDTRTVTTATTDAAGNWSATLPARGGLLLRALHAERPAVASSLVSLSASPAGDVAEVL